MLMAVHCLLAQASSPVRAQVTLIWFHHQAFCVKEIAGVNEVIGQQFLYVVLSYSGNVKDLLSFCQLLLAFFHFCLTRLLLSHLAFECLQIFQVDCVKDRSLFCDKSFRWKGFIKCGACGIKLEQIISHFLGHDFLGYYIMKDLQIILALLCRRCHRVVMFLDVPYNILNISFRTSSWW